MDESGAGAANLQPHDCWGLLRTTTVGRLAISVANHPDIFPINYVVDHGTVVFRTAKGTKFDGAVLGASVAFETDGFDSDAGEAWSVVVKGRASEVKRADDLLDTASLPLYPLHASPKCRFVRITPTSITGLRFAVADSSSWDNPLTNAPHTPPA